MYRYTAVLQRFDDAIVEVAQGDSRHEVVAAANMVYASLIPAVLSRTHDVLIQQRREGREDDFIIDRPQELEHQLRGMEYGVGVYDRKPQPTVTDLHPSTELVFWVGATREDPRL